MGGNSVKTNFIEFRNISTLKEKVINGAGTKVMNSKVTKDVKDSISSVLDFF
jgi:hypothetical protein